MKNIIYVNGNFFYTTCECAHVHTFAGPIRASARLRTPPHASARLRTPPNAHHCGQSSMLYQYVSAGRQRN